MVIGKTSSSISKTEIFSKYSETQVLCAVFPEITEIPCRISSPFRVDNNPSFSIYLNDSKHVCFKDHGDKDCRGGLLDLLCKKWDCSFNQVFDKIIDLMQKQEGQDVSIKPKQIKVLTRKEATEMTNIQVAVRPWRDYDYEYWASYGVEKQWLKYAEIYPISHKIITKKGEDGKSKKYIFPADKYAYVFVERKEGQLQLKVYQPLNTKGYKWCMKMDSSVISLWTKVPEYGDRIVICSSVKDALCISCQLHIPAIAPQGEGYNISETACNELRRRYKQVFISFDTDEPGLKDAQSLAEKTGFKNVVPDLGTEKDFSDAFKKYGKEWFIKNIPPLFK
jgi:hypothetical protein